jgi:hypothetical protein
VRPDPKEIQQLAGGTGKLLEVACAREFLKYGHDWRVHLGSYFDDGQGPPRELDVLATREERVQHERGAAVYRVRAVISCRGFPDDAYPLTYSVASASPLVLPSRLPLALRGWQESHLHRFGSQMAVAWLTHTRTNTERPIVALDVLQPNDEHEKYLARQSRQQQRTQQQPPPSHVLKGDRRIFGAIDSAVKASIYWVGVDHNAPGFAVATLAVPICVFSTEFSDINIDDGNLAPPELRSRAYLTSGYPSYHPHPAGHASITTLVIADTEIGSIIPALETLFVEFRNAADATLA